MTLAERLAIVLDHLPPATFARGGGGARAAKAGKGKGKGGGKVGKVSGPCGANAPGGGGFQKGNTCGGAGGARIAQKAAAQRVRERLEVKGRAAKAGAAVRAAEGPPGAGLAGMIARSKQAAAKGGQVKAARDKAALERRQARNAKARERRAARRELALAAIKTSSAKADRSMVLGRMVAKSREAAAKADPLNRIEATRVQQRVANAAAARAKPVYDLDRPSQRIELYKKDIEANAQRIKDTEREAERLRPEYEKVKAKVAEAYRKLSSGLSSRSAKAWEEKLKDLRPEHERLIEAVEWAPDKIKSFQNQAKHFEDRLAAAVADPANRPTLEYGKLQAKFPDLIPPGPITQRLAAYTVGDAKVKAVVAIGAKYEKRAADLKARKEAHGKVIRKYLEEQAALVDPYAARSQPIPPDVEVKVNAIQVKVDAEFVAQRNINAKDSWLGARQRAEVERVLRVKDRADIDAPDVPEGYKDAFGKEFRPLHKGLREQADDAAAWMSRNVARGDESTAVVPLGDGGEAQRAHHGFKHIALGTHDSSSTVVHEFGHAIDSRFKTGPDYVSARSREFLAHRVGDEPTTNLREKFGGYDAHEAGRKDKFDDAFGEHSAYYVGKHYESGVTEILSMGMQKVHDDPVGFAKKDPEYFKFTVGIMDGSLR